MAVRLGITQVQGTINGYGERCGNADLCSIIPGLTLKMGFQVLGNKHLARLQELSLFVSELANVVPDNRQPYVGASAFAHKGGMHVDAVRKSSVTFEHIDPHLVGNRRRILVSELSGKGNILARAAECGIHLEKDTPEMHKILIHLKTLEHEGYQFEAADGSFELLIRKIKGERRKFFSLEGFHVSVEKREDNKLISEAIIKIKVQGKREHTAAEGDGPVNALDNALRKALVKFYPSLREMHLSDFRVRVLDAKEGTAAKVRVLLESRDAKDTWNTIGVSENIIEASWQALVDSIEYKLLKDGE
jgi:2-isopropylmalate synthase